MRKSTRMTGTALATAAFFSMAGAAQAETLREALAKAYQTNPTLNAARAGQRATDENVPLALSQGRPNVGVTGIYTEELHRALPNTTPKRNAVGSADADVPIYQGGIVRNSIRAAKKSVEAGQEDLRGTESSVFAAVVAAYLDVIRDSAIVQFNQQNVSALEVNLQASSDRFEVGDLTRTDVAQSDSRLALAQADLQAAEARLISSKENYIALVGSAPVDLEAPPALPGMPETPQTAVQVAMQDNPDILGARYQREAAHYDTNSAKGQIAPRLSAFANGTYLDYLNSETAAQGVGSVKSASVGVQLTIPIYQGGRPGALTRQAKARENQALEIEIATERNVIAQTRSAYASWQASLLAIESTKKAVSSGELSLEGVRAENTAGTRTILDILDSQRDLLNAQVQYVTAQRNAYVAGFSLLAAMGHAEARDLGLDGGPLYDPNVNYKQVHGKLFDFDFGPKIEVKSTTTSDVPAQNAVPISDVKNN
ncbi:MAG: TolC family outer membrane protein [Sphingobium sp.]